MGWQVYITSMRGLVFAVVWGFAATVSAGIDEAAPLVRAGDDAGALQALGAGRDPETRYLRGRLLENLGDAAGAAAEFDGLTELPAVVLRDAAFRRARALARAGECADARPLLEGVDAPRSEAQVARALLGECALREGRADAGALLEAVVAENGQQVDTFSAALEQVQAVRAAGDTARATEILQRLHVERPTHPDAAEVARAGYDASGLTPAERLQRAEALLEARSPAEAAAELVGEPPAALRSRWLHVQGMALFQTRQDYAESARVLDRAWRSGGDTAVEDRFHAARALSRADDDVRGIRAYRALVRAHPRHPLAARAEYLAAWLEIRLGRRQGERSMERFLRGPRASGALAADATWHLGLRAFERGDHARAVTYFERYARLDPDGLEEARGRYWLGRALETRGRRTAAIAAYRRARAIDPLQWYGLHANKRLVGLGVEEPIPWAAAQDAEAPVSFVMPPVAAFYHRLGLRRDALDTLRSSESALRDAAPRGRVNETLVSAYAALGGAEPGYRLATLERARLARAPTGSALWAWEAAYPRPYEQEVRRVAERAGIPWEQVFATMRQESAYDPDAVSQADAIGLLQVMPEVGARLASRLGLPFTRQRLFDPAWNLRLGIQEIADLRVRFHGSLVASVAAFNAGSARVDRWIAECPRCPLDLFVEKIPFDETRRYVERVVSHFAHYRYMADPAAQVPLEDSLRAP